MKLKLIQAGGFVGKTMMAEEDVSNYPVTFLRYLEKMFADRNKGMQQPGKPAGQSRDQFQYFIEFKEQRLPLEALPVGEEEAGAEFSRLLKTLKERLRY